jgi:hypothetical protein
LDYLTRMRGDLAWQGYVDLAVSDGPPVDQDETLQLPGHGQKQPFKAKSS